MDHISFVTVLQFSIAICLSGPNKLYFLHPKSIITATMDDGIQIIVAAQEDDDLNDLQEDDEVNEDNDEDNAVNEDENDENDDEYESDEEDLSLPLITAAVDGDLTAVYSLLEQGTDKNETTNRQRTALWHAAKNGHVEILRLLLEQGADKEKADDKYDTPLLIASDIGHLEVVQVLLEQGADIEKADIDGHTSLIIASANGNLEICRYLLEQGADKDKFNNVGRYTSLHYAAEFNHLEVLKLLMLYEANLDARTEDDQIAIDMVWENGFNDEINEEVRQAIRDEPQRRRDNRPRKRCIDEVHQPNAVALSSSEQEEDNEEEEQSDKVPRLDEGEAEDGKKVAEEDEDSEPSDAEDN